MGAPLALAIGWGEIALCGAVFVIGGLLFLLYAFAAELGRLEERERQACRERDEARKTLELIRRMSEIRVETVTRMRGFTG